MPETSTPRRPWLAALLNALFPGLGHLYAGDTKNIGLGGAVPLVTLTGMAFLIFFAPPSLGTALFFLALPFLSLALLAFLGWRSAARASSPFSPGRWNQWYWYVGYGVAISGFYALAVRPWFNANLFQTYRIPSESMSPTLVVGDFVVVDKRNAFQGTLFDGEVVVFRSPEDPSLEVLKRIGGAPGDTLEMRQGVLYRDGVADRRFVLDSVGPAPLTPEMLAQMREWQSKYFAGPVPPGYTPDAANWGPIDVPRFYFFALGDNRAQSWDSRYYGLVPINKVLGRPRMIYFNKDLFTPGNFARIGKGIE